MLKLVNIRKVYNVADLTVNALDGIDLCFRKNEFVSILGPSGCGKTTTLNIIGGLDKYTSGDLVIDGKSTKQYTDHDWDVYRNHHIGFVFQSYNLIPHQTILGNVELALTISGVPKKERIERAKKALDRVGLAKMYYKKPNQLSGGQCQRVAIARALVNEPDILLADEPTGALDTQTSIQIMELIKEISKEKLVIMVTHNPELAEKYSTRIVRLLDGKLKDDSNPCSVEEEEKERALEIDKNVIENKNHDKAKMSLLTAFKLSSRNLYTKFKRTLMVALAGCIGIVGVSTVLAVSNGVQGYINDMENDMLSGYPVYITTSSLDYGSIMGGGLATSTSNVNPENDKTKAFINSLVNTLVNMNGVTSTNSISKKYIDFLSDMPEEACELIQYKYGYQIAPNIYTDFKTSDGKTHKMSVAAIQATYASVLENVKEFSSYASMISSVTVMTELPSKASYLANQYDIVYLDDKMTFEDVINDESSLIAVVSKNHNTLNDLELAEYGYFSQEKFLNYCYKVGGSDLYDDNPYLQIPDYLEYKDLAKKNFTWYPNNTVYKKGDDDKELGEKYYASAYADGTLASETDSRYDNYKFDAFSDNVEGKVDLNVKCVLKLKKDLSYGSLQAGGLYYTNALTKHMREYTVDSEIAKSAKKSGSLYNVELGYNFTFDGQSTQDELKTNYLTGGNSAIMDYIQQFISVSGSSGSGKKVTSYSLASLGGAENPASVYFYCNDFNQKDLLTQYLDKWNDPKTNNLFKVDTNGFYVGHTEDENGKDQLAYFYYNDENKKYFRVNLNSEGYATDALGNRYKLIKDEKSGNYEFHRKLDDEYGEKFDIEGKMKLTDSVSLNAFTLASYVIFGDEFSIKENIYGKDLEAVPNKGDKLFRYKDVKDTYHYLMKVQNQTYYKVILDKDGNIVATRDGYKKYRYDGDTNQFYSLDYVIFEYNYKEVLDEVSYEANKYYYLNDNNEYVIINSEYSFDKNKEKGLYLRDGVKSYKLSSDSPLDEDNISSLYSEEKPYNYANGVKNPTFTINDEEYTLDTKGLYIDTTSFEDMNSSSLLNYIKIDTTNKKITIRDYSQFKFYYRDENDNDTKYYYVDYEEKDGISYIHGKNMSAFIDSSTLSNTKAKDYISDTYIINNDGTLQSVSEAFSKSSLTDSDMINLGIIGKELKDTSILEIDDSIKVTYTDTIGLVISMVGILIQIITYALIAFTALSLVVSTVMIGIITYVSVVERTKEIGIIRAIGGRKKDVSHLFNAETFIIGISAGVLGIIITYLLSLIINLVVGSFTGIYTIAALPWYQALIMIGISVFLTLISGLIPAKSAARKDPVIALRSE